MNQALKQRQATKKFDKKNQLRRTGKYTEEDNKVEYPVSKWWIAALVFLVCGGAILELIRMFF